MSPASISIVDPQNGTVYPEATTIAVTVESVSLDAEITLVTLIVDDVPHPSSCDMMGTCVFEDVALEADGEHVLYAKAHTDIGDVAWQTLVYVGEPPPAPTTDDSSGSETDGASDTDGGETDAAGSDTEAGSDTSAETEGGDTEGGDGSSDKAGCACSVDDGSSGVAGLLFAALLGLVRRRR